MPSFQSLYITRSVPAAALMRAVGTSTLSVRFRVQRQRPSQWCWAAVSASVADFLEEATEWTQCKVAGGMLGGNCCTAPTPERCNVRNTLDGPLRLVEHYRDYGHGHIASEALRREFCADLPVPIRVGWRAGGGHFLAIHGLRDLAQGVQLMLTDPIYGECLIMTDDLLRGGYLKYGGYWSDTYVVKRK